MLVFLQFGQWWWVKPRKLSLGYNQVHELRKLNKLRKMPLSSLLTSPLINIILVGIGPKVDTKPWRCCFLRRAVNLHEKHQINKYYLLSKFLSP